MGLFTTNKQKIILVKNVNINAKNVMNNKIIVYHVLVK